MLKKNAHRIADAIDASGRLCGTLNSEGKRLFALFCWAVLRAGQLERNVMLRAALKAIQ